MGPKEGTQNMTKRNGIIAGASLVVLLAVFMAGRYSRPPRPESVVYSDSTASTSTFAAMVHATLTTVATESADTSDHSTTRIKYVWRWRPDGTVEATATTDEAKDVETHRTRDKRTDDVRDTATTGQQTVVETHAGSATYARPAWSFGLSGGVARQHAVPIFGPVIVGGQIGHRIAGPFFLDISGNTSPAVLATLRIDL